LVHRRIEPLGEEDAAMNALSIDERMPRRDRLDGRAPGSPLTGPNRSPAARGAFGKRAPTVISLMK
jgi:hypothetical protein